MLDIRFLLLTRDKLQERGLHLFQFDQQEIQEYYQNFRVTRDLLELRNIATVAQERGVRTIPEFFNARLAERVAGEIGQADVILANNVMAHIPDINDVFNGVAHLLKPDGVAIIETPYVRELVDRNEFDTIYHEHVFYYSLTSLDRLLQRHGLVPIGVERMSIHGGSLRVTARHARRQQSATPAVGDLLREEAECGLSRLGYYTEFSDRVSRLQTKIRDTIDELRFNGMRVAAYGAGAKGTVLLNSIGADPRLLEFVADRSSYKQGRFMPGARIPIVSPDRILETMPDYVLLLTWNFAEEIMSQQKEYRRRGGRFIVPIPDVRTFAMTAN